jgi:enoyl-CoA hydratase
VGASESKALETVALDSPADGVTVVKLSRPERLNAINATMVSELHRIFAGFGSDRSVRVVIVTGEGRGFCSGMDMKAFGAVLPAEDAPAFENLAHQERMAALPRLLRDVPQPVIAAVNGAAVGGGFAMVLGADIRICSRSARFGNAAIRLGLSGAEMGMSYHLPRIVGTSVAAEWMLTGRMVAADEALSTRLVSTVADDDQLMPVAIGLASQIAGHSPLATRLTKAALQRNTDAPGLDAAVETENRGQVIAAASAEYAAARQGWTQ